MKYDSKLTVLVCFFCLVGLRIQAQDMGLKTLAQGLTFHASFDGQVDADYAQGDSKFYTAESYKMADQATPGLNHPDVKLSSGKGRYGDALEFQKKNSKALFFKGPGNVEYSDTNWSGTVSFWLSLDPAKDLEPGYCDPIQVTDSDWNDAALWVDFNKEPRDFRLGVLGDLSVWNPNDEDATQFDGFLNRVVTVKQPPFASGKWTHVVFTFSGLNQEGARAKLYLDGKHQGTSEVIKEPFTWDPSKSAVRLGISYVGLFDDLAVFNRVLTDEQVSELYNLPGGVAELHR